MENEKKEDSNIELGSGILDEIIIIDGVMYEYQK